MEFRAHGANPEKLYAAAGLPTPAKIYDFSTNTNAVPQREGFVPDLRAALEDYPDGDCLALREALAREFGAPAKNILVSSGSNEAIYIIASYAAARENLILQPVYGEYKKALDGYGARTRNIFSLAEAEGARGAAVWLCNPCNPTGALISGAELDATAERNSETLFIIDEAYRDFVWTEELPRAPKILPNVVRLRSLTKIYDLCGARVGALVSHEAAVEKIKARQPEWSVSGLAQQAALWRAGDETLKARTLLRARNSAADRGAARSRLRRAPDLRELLPSRSAGRRGLHTLHARTRHRSPPHAELRGPRRQIRPHSGADERRGRFADCRGARVREGARRKIANGRKFHGGFPTCGEAAVFCARGGARRAFAF